MWACQEGHQEVVRELCERGANVNAACNTDGYTALMEASRKGHLSVVQALLNHGASKSAVSHTGSNAHDVAAGDDIAALRALLKV